MKWQKAADWLLHNMLPLSRENVTCRSVPAKIARHFDVPLDVLMFGEEPKMNAYFLTRRGAGVSVERTKAYKYESLASGFRNRIADPFIVTVEPKPEKLLSISIHMQGRNLIW